MAAPIKKILVKKYKPGASAQFYQAYALRFHDEMSVLDALCDIKDREDASLAFRWSCRMGICGSCGMTVNGKPVLACQTPLKNLGREIKVEPLRNFPVIKDLVSDIDGPFEQMRSTMPYVSQMSQKALENGEYLQTPRQRKALEQTSQCIKCMLCYSACPVYGNDKKFIGPAAAALAYRYNADSRDQSKSQRLKSISGKEGVWKCSFVGECSVVCPKRVDPATALQRLKLMGALNSLNHIHDA